MVHSDATWKTIALRGALSTVDRSTFVATDNHESLRPLLAGIHIFLAEFQAFLGDRASLLIPPDIEQRLSKGSTERYNAQYRKFKHLTSSIPSVQCLIDLINLYHRAYDQEGYIVQGMEKGAVQKDRL